MIHLLRERASLEQIDEMLEALGLYIKLAVDIRQGIAAGGGEMHADCEVVLLEGDSRQEDIWGADWRPEAKQVTFEALINIRPKQNNRSMEILDPSIRNRVQDIVRNLMGAE